MLKELVRKYAAWVLFAAILVYGVLVLVAQPAPQRVFLEKREALPLVIAHKGGEGLAPPNTLEAFAVGLENGADVIETDARLTMDGHVVLFHDETVDTTTDGTGSIEMLSLSEVKGLDAGYGWSPDGGKTFPFRAKQIEVPTLREALRTFPGTRFNIDMKTHSEKMVKATLEAVRQENATDRVLVTSFDGETARRFRELAPAIASSLASDEVRLFFGLQLARLSRAYTPPAAAVQVPEYEGSIHVLTPGFVAAAHLRGMQVHAWTINDEEDMRRLLAMGVDGIITDYPDLLSQLVAEVSGQ